MTEPFSSRAARGTPAVSWKGTLVQHTGRLHRPSPGKTEVRICDYADPAVPLLAPACSRSGSGGNRTIGREETPLG